MGGIGEILDRLRPHVQRTMGVFGTPGLALALTSRRATLGVETFGAANLDSGAPVAPSTLFEIGSIGKSFTAAVLMQLAEEGAADLHAAVSAYLPWFSVRSRFVEPITLHHLLTHTGGLVRGADITSDSLFDVWAVGRTETGSPPGVRFHYSNVGYRVLGAVLEAVTGQPYPELIRTRVLERVGMSGSEPAITNAVRSRMATGYVPWPDDRPGRYEDVAPATWMETSTADGSVASTAEDMAAYLRLWLNRGIADNGSRVVSEQSFDLMTRAAAVRETEELWYGYALETWAVDRRSYLGHGGSMVGYASAMFGDLEAGVGAVVLINGPDHQDFTMDLTRYALHLLRAAAQGDDLPPAPPAPDPGHVENADEYAGRWWTIDGEEIEIVADGDRLWLRHGGTTARVERRAADRFHVERPDLRDLDLQVMRQGGEVVAFGHGPRSFHRATGRSPAKIRDRSAYCGRFRSYNPWRPVVRTFQRGDQLVLASPDGTEEPLVPLDEHVFRVGQDEGSPERISFDAFVEGRALRATLSGERLYRTLGG